MLSSITAALAADRQRALHQAAADHRVARTLRSARRARRRRSPAGVTHRRRDRSTPPEIEALGTILGVWAHPDDEAYLSAGLMALARRAGQRVVLVTATAGDQGAPDPNARGAALAERRTHELAASLGRLDVREHHLLGLPDGGCAAVPAHSATDRIARLITAVRPDTIVTFGVEGMTGHDDHRAVHRWTLDAWRTSGAAARLLCATVTPAFHAEWGEVNESLGVWEGTPPCTPEHELALAVDCRPVLDQKLDALLAHASQVGPLIESMGLDAFRRWWATESFVEVRRP